MSQQRECCIVRLMGVLHQSRGISMTAPDEILNQGQTVLKALTAIIGLLEKSNKTREANTLKDVLEICRQPRELGGLDISKDEQTSSEQEAEIMFLSSAWLEALNSVDRAASLPDPILQRPVGRRGMTLSEKIFAMHDLTNKGFVVPGELIRVHVDWVIASEASWAGMERTYETLGRPGIFRNDRFWLAGDHVVDPRVNKLPKVRALIDASERAKKVFKMTDYQGMNYTILHTEFYRERAQPGMVIVGSDSHTCSSGALGCLAIGLGAADVTLPLVTGETWFKVPECINIRLVGAPKPGIGGKDVILYILQQLKRNTVASDRIVEFTGPGVTHLSCDARFAICNMTTEFGGITGIFEPDQITQEFVQKRHLVRHKNLATYFKPDGDAAYAATYEIDLGNVRSFLARYPKPDDVVPVQDCEGMKLDGCFIGACTTAEEDLILGALVLEQGLKAGKRPESGLINIYENAGFEIGIPGCSYCVGMSADQAGPGEVWLSSQNRNFENRMGKGSIGHLASAVTVAASSFDMRVTDPHELLAAIDLQTWNELRGVKSSEKGRMSDGPQYMEPCGAQDTSPITLQRKQSSDGVAYLASRTGTTEDFPTPVMTGKVQRLGDFIDTDALAPAEFLISMKDNEFSGLHCLEYTHPEFRARVGRGLNIVVAGKGFGCGSSREQAVMALLGCGVQCVIARSFAFIFQRNMPNLGLLGITMQDEQFFEAATEGVDITIDFQKRALKAGGKEFQFQLSQMEKRLYDHGGISSAFRHFGKHLFEAMTTTRYTAKSYGELAETKPELQW
ncbi:aconitase family protein [Penicillium daleae]|uniref:Aconitase family protein n=1 Tax=Penicillium daleae TaxID=63821 RepID=A0AAD6G2J0_9EURO|nr:aconitase family protein [Penicillium daleae]KAJ5453461.1 aconitase family protein [Penicillium daleae]